MLPEADISRILPGLDVSRETMDKLAQYHALLLKWQKSINLISPSTIDSAWERHFADSLQLLQFIPPHIKTILDIGSGAGFPGLVLAMVRPDITVHLAESDGKKCSFLKTVSRETKTEIFIHNERIENLSPTTIKPDMVSARALASLDKLLVYMRPFYKENHAIEGLFLKGEKAESEIEEARKFTDFTVDIHKSSTDTCGQILHVRDINFA